MKAAKKSGINRKDPFDGYEEYLKPHLNKDFLKLKNGLIDYNKMHAKL